MNREERFLLDGSVPGRRGGGVTAGSRGTAWTLGQSAWFKSHVNTSTLSSPPRHPHLRECSSGLSHHCCLKVSGIFLTFSYTGTRNDPAPSGPWCSSTAPDPFLSLPGWLSQGVPTYTSSSPPSSLCCTPAVIPSLCFLHQVSPSALGLVTPAKACEGFKITWTFDQHWHSVFLVYFIFSCKGSPAVFV